ncbi:transporter [bacterium AH-315-J04]|nr:transporter [bacterium AH-315-J04]
MQKIKRRAKYTLALLMAGTLTSTSFAGPINSDVAFTPRKGGGVLRMQYTYADAHGRGSARNVREVQTSIARVAVVLGLEANLAMIINVPYVYRERKVYDSREGSVEDRRDGPADTTLLLKYRFWQDDSGPLQTERLAALFGVNLSNGDSSFSSDSYDPIVGLVYSWRRDRKVFDADMVYTIKTGEGNFDVDSLRYDLAYSYRIFPERFSATSESQWSVVAEMNGRYNIDGTHEIFLSPGIQYTSEQRTWEASFQLPTVQELASNGVETDYRFSIGWRFRW